MIALAEFFREREAETPTADSTEVKRESGIASGALAGGKVVEDDCSV
jgi:hypothetical protein